MVIDCDRCTRGFGVGEEEFNSLISKTHTEIANVLQDLRSYRDLEHHMCAPYRPRKWTEAKVVDEARAAGFDGIESALVAFLNGHGGQAGSLWASFVASHAQAQQTASTPPNSRPGPMRLCLGGTKPTDGWTIVNALPLPGVDVVCDAGDLRPWADGSVEEVARQVHAYHTDARTYTHAHAHAKRKRDSVPACLAVLSSGACEQYHSDAYVLTRVLKGFLVVVSCLLCANPSLGLV